VLRLALLSAVLLSGLSATAAHAESSEDTVPPLQPCYRVTVTAPPLGHDPSVLVCIPDH
jgi:hypothetical protein